MKARHVLLSVTPKALTTITAQFRECLRVTSDVSGATGVPRDQGETVVADCMQRYVTCDLETFMALGSDRGKSFRFQGEQDLRCFPLKFLANSESRVSPCSLHIALGLVKSSLQWATQC